MVWAWVWAQVVDSLYDWAEARAAVRPPLHQPAPPCMVRGESVGDSASNTAYVASLKWPSFSIFTCKKNHPLPSPRLSTRTHMYRAWSSVDFISSAYLWRSGQARAAGHGRFREVRGVQACAKNKLQVNKSVHARYTRGGGAGKICIFWWRRPRDRYIAGSTDT